MSRDPKVPIQAQARAVAAFLEKVRQAPVAVAGGGRLLFALDATASRQATWDQAVQIQAEMFHEAAALGGLQVQLAYYRGMGEFVAGSWHPKADGVVAAMTAVRCLGGQTQILKVIKHAIAETQRQRIAAVVFVGDAMEEAIDDLCAAAGQLGLLGVPMFLFHEGHDPLAEGAFQQLARLSGGACCHFDASSAHQLRDLLRAVAAYAAGGRRALENQARRGGAAVQNLLTQLK
ncbi:MAG: VWA domain-containing protein [Alphaproteobacteria bacterium]|nr:VWA domain-containing protein [Alphaproteobacteria bacterium]